MTERSPETTTEEKGLIRLAGWNQVRAAHERGEIRAVEVRASDYFGAGVGGTAHLGRTFFTAVRRSKTAHVIGRPEIEHSWSYLPDIVTTLIAASDHTAEWGRVWHVPSGAASRTAIVTQLNELHKTRGKVSGYPQWLLRSMGMVSPMLRAVYASSYQFLVPYVIDSADTERELGVRATPWDQALAATAESYR